RTVATAVVGNSTTATTEVRGCGRGVVDGGDRGQMMELRLTNISMDRPAGVRCRFRVALRGPGGRGRGLLLARVQRSRYRQEPLRARRHHHPRAYAARWCPDRWPRRWRSCSAPAFGP